MKIIPAYRRETGQHAPFQGEACLMCGDPDRAPGEWHSEDYSEPFSYEPPASMPMCKPCHMRLHKRFNAPEGEWSLFCRHLEAGGYGREFVALYPTAKRARIIAALRDGDSSGVEPVRPVTDRTFWWRDLTMDPESLAAPWARPRPLRPRPSQDSYREALKSLTLSDTEQAMLRLHANAPRRAITMRALASAALGSTSPSAANLAYGGLARRLAQTLNFAVDRRKDGTPVWMSVIAEGWQPESRPEYEWVMVPALRSAVLDGLPTS
ncbi:MAG: hypothetical protein V2J26_05000 [Pacificimonas sp.]|jgi:hypothetical protein|nr:hypothetical protein [Pacificimonas sp.]